jgi:hypothetical protein
LRAIIDEAQDILLSAIAFEVPEVIAFDPRVKPKRLHPTNRLMVASRHTAWP